MKQGGKEVKVLFLHLSDAHFRENTKLNDININAIVKSLIQLDEFDECVLVFSGDIAWSGEVNQYKKAKEFIGILIQQIKNNYLSNDKLIHTLFVPGNHDNLVKNLNRDVKELKSYYSEFGKIDDEFYSELEQLSNFYEFANRNFCFKKGKVVDVRKIKFEKFIIKVNLINTAPFSLLCTGNEDKGLHYIPQKEINKLDFEMRENYTVSIIHHSPEWFSDKSKQLLYNKLYETSDLIFIGHEHFSLSETKTVNGRFNVDVSNGLALYGTDTEQGYNALLLDTENRTLEGKRFIYKGTFYKPDNFIQKHIIQFKEKNKYNHTQEFAKFLETDVDERNGEKYLDYFVFPSLESKSIDDTKNYTISTEKKFLELFSSKGKISIEGNSKSGKTILAKYLCKVLSENYIPIYLDETNFCSKDNIKMIKYAFINQYGDTVDMDEFWQLDAEKKVLIVDGYDKLKKEKWKTFLYEIEKKFGHIVFFGGVDWNFNIKEKTIEELSENNIFYLKISPFYYSKREQLIHKICAKFKDKEVKDIEDKVRKINEEITNQIKFFQLTPDFIHKYVDYYLNFSYTKIQKESNVFSKVYETNLTYRLSKYAGEENVAEIMVALDFVAHYIHFNKKYRLSLTEFEKVIELYNDEYDNKLSSKFIYGVAIKSNIIRGGEENFEIEFCDKNLLAYFTALHLNRKFNDGQGEEELKYILDNICFQPNGDIVLFLSYITSNIQILNPIVASLVKHMKKWDELNIDLDNVGYLTKLHMLNKPSLPNEASKIKMKEEKTNMEKEIFEQYKCDSESIYSYDETKVDSFENKISKGMAYLELLAKILPNFRHILKRNQKQEIVELLYKYPNKLLYFMLRNIDSNHDKIINDILESAPKTKKGKLITKDMISRALQNQSVGYILSIYDFIASTAVNGKTISDLNKFNYGENTNYIIQNIMMEENADNFIAMAQKAEFLFKNTKLNVVKHMIILIVRKYLLCHNISLVGEYQRLADLFFGQDKKQKKAILMAQARNRFIKK